MKAQTRCESPREPRSEARAKGIARVAVAVRLGFGLGLGCRLGARATCPTARPAPALLQLSHLLFDFFLALVASTFELLGECRELGFQLLTGVAILFLLSLDFRLAGFLFAA